MPRGKAEQAEVIIPKLREVEVELGRGKTVAEAVKKIGVPSCSQPLEQGHRLCEGGFVTPAHDHERGMAGAGVTARHGRV